MRCPLIRAHTLLIAIRRAQDRVARVCERVMERSERAGGDRRGCRAARMRETAAGREPREMPQWRGGTPGRFQGARKHSCLNTVSSVNFTENIHRNLSKILIRL